MDVNEFMIDRALDLLGIIPHITTIIHAVYPNTLIILTITPTIVLIPTILVTGPVSAINPVVVIF